VSDFALFSKYFFSGTALATLDMMGTNGRILMTFNRSVIRISAALIVKRTSECEAQSC
jgi:hypothetical protein